MSLNQLQNRIQTAIDDLNRSRKAEYQGFANDALALIKRRVINTGKDKDGNSFDGYSEAQVPYWYFFGKGADRAARKIREQGYFGSYKLFRELAGRVTDFKNFSFTNGMWRNTAAAVLVNGFNIAIRFVGKNARANKLLQIHDAQDQILSLSSEDRKLLQEAVRQRFKTRLQ